MRDMTFAEIRTMLNAGRNTPDSVYDDAGAARHT